jgi:hemerythrin-like domain-containing protein
MAKKAKKAKSKKTAKQAVKRRAPKAKAKKAAPKPRPTRASKTKVAARAAAMRKEQKPKQRPGKIASAAKVAAGLALLAMDAVTKRVSWSKNENDPIELLKTDHRRFENLLKEGEATTERAKKTRRQILTSLTSELNVHEALEEKIFYPALQPHAEAHDLVLESFQEHHVADQIVKELHEVDKDDEQWGAKFKVLKENVEHHISEEENKLFPVAKGVLGSDQLLALGKEMRKLKSQLER